MGEESVGVDWVVLEKGRGQQIGILVPDNSSVCLVSCAWWMGAGQE